MMQALRASRMRKNLGWALIDEVEEQGGINEAHDFGFDDFGAGADGFRAGLG
jgi:hypothetical protein